jgi:hypothetical protein
MIYMVQIARMTHSLVIVLLSITLIIRFVDFHTRWFRDLFRHFRRDGFHLNIVGFGALQVLWFNLDL